MVGKKYVVLNWNRQIQEPFSAYDMTDFIKKGRDYCGIAKDEAVSVVVEETGMLVNDFESFQTLGTWSKLMILTDRQKWTPELPTIVSCPQRFLTNCSGPENLSHLRSNASSIVNDEEISNKTDSNGSQPDHDSDDDLGKEYAEDLINKILMEANSASNKSKRIHCLVRPLGEKDLLEIMYATIFHFPESGRDLVWEIKDAASVLYCNIYEPDPNNWELKELIRNAEDDRIIKESNPEAAVLRL